jgi:hypothetical protein
MMTPGAAHVQVGCFGLARRITHLNSDGKNNRRYRNIRSPNLSKRWGSVA